MFFMIVFLSLLKQVHKKRRKESTNRRQHDLQNNCLNEILSSQSKSLAIAVIRLDVFSFYVFSFREDIYRPGNILDVNYMVQFY